MNYKKINYFICVFFMIGFVLRAEAHPECKPFPAFKIAGNLYYVGDSYQADYLVVTSQGNILINSGYEDNVASVQASVEKLGFKFSDIKVFLISHAHVDHAGGAALVKKETGAQLMVMDADVPVVESGGKADFHYGSSADAENFYQPVKVDRVLHDGDQVKLGDTVLVAHHTGGHTKGCTTWTMNVNDHGINYRVVIVGGPYVNPGYSLVHNVKYPMIAQDYEHSFQVLKELDCDIFLGAHGMYFDLEKKYASMKEGKKNPFVDAKGYQEFVAKKKYDFEQELRDQSED